MTTDILLITRPEPQASAFAGSCRDRFGPDLRIVVAPLIGIVTRPGPVATQGHAGLIFTSANGVRSFAARSADRSLPAWCVGAQTAAAARAVGLDARSADGDRHDLAAMIAADPPGGTLLHLRGAETAGDLPGALGRHGIAVASVVIYDQTELPLSDAARALLAGTAPVLVPLFSPRAARIAAAAFAAATAPLHIAAISPAVAEAVPVQAAGRVAIAARPDAAALLDALETLRL